MNQTLTLSNEWDKVFPKSQKVNHSKVTFHNRYGITLVADMYAPKNAGGVVDPLPDDAPFFVKDYYDYYKTKHGVSRKKPKLQRRLEYHFILVIPEYADFAVLK